QGWVLPFLKIYTFLSVKKALIFKAFGVSVMVIRTGFEPATPTLSRILQQNIAVSMTGIVFDISNHLLPVPITINI
ncbi:hypothetical protein QYF48_15340, partial [Brevibacillus agri]|uniref:hypothetical protein n=1 Tax=Brevibacillus agri TaxID=51101 RepID=UPI0025B6B936